MRTSTVKSVILGFVALLNSLITIEKAEAVDLIEVCLPVVDYLKDGNRLASEAQTFSDKYDLYASRSSELASLGRTCTLADQYANTATSLSAMCCKRLPKKRSKEKFLGCLMLSIPVLGGGLTSADDQLNAAEQLLLEAIGKLDAAIDELDQQIAACRAERGSTTPERGANELRFSPLLR